MAAVTLLVTLGGGLAEGFTLPGVPHPLLGTPRVRMPTVLLGRTRPVMASTGGNGEDMPEEGESLEEEWSKLQVENRAGAAAAAIIDSELDPKRRALWKQLRRESEKEAVSAAVRSLDGEPDADGSKPDWRVRSRALAELQYWVITTGNPNAESALLDIIQRSYASERWLAVEADGLLRKAWSVHQNATVNLRMEAARGLLREGKARAAADAFAEVARACRSSSWVEALRWQARVEQLAIGNPSVAIELYESALARSPRNYPLLFELGALLVKDAAAEAQIGGPRSKGSAARAVRGAELLSRSAELNPLLLAKVSDALGQSDDDE